MKVLKKVLYFYFPDIEELLIFNLLSTISKNDMDPHAQQSNNVQEMFKFTLPAVALNSRFVSGGTLTKTDN